MPRRDWRLRVSDILAAIERIERYTAGQLESGFVRDERTVEAVWQTATVDVPALKPFLRALLAK